MKYSDAEAIPPCEFSAHCMRLLDDLDAPGDESAHRRRLMADARDVQDEYLIEKLRAHVPGCPVCSARVAEARLQRSQQRLTLRRYLVEAESRVPSTAERILSMAQQTSQEETEQPSSEQKRQRYMLPELFIPFTRPQNNDAADDVGHFDSVTEHTPPAVHSTSLWLRNSFALATAAALIFAVMGVFNHFVSHNSTTPVHEKVQSWPSIMIGMSVSVASMAVVSKYYNVDTTTGAEEQMTPSGQPAQNMQYEAISPDGKNVLAHFFTNDQVVYMILSMGKSGSVVTRAAITEANNAIWMDNDHILVAFVHQGVVEFDIHTGSMVRQMASLANVHLLFYHAPYLYFQNAQQTALYRGNLATDDQKQLATNFDGMFFTHCVLHPEGIALYCEGQIDRLSRTGSNLYLLNGDGLGVQSLSRRGMLLGFAPDHTLLFLQATLNNYQVVKLGKTLSQDHVVMHNAAPASATIGDGDAMLAPDGHGMVMQVNDANPSQRGVWYDDFTTQTSREVFPYLPGSSCQLIGWDQLPVSSSPLPVATAA